MDDNKYGDRFLLMIGGPVQQQFKESMNEYMERIHKLKEDLNEQFGIKNVMYDPSNYRDEGVFFDGVRLAIKTAAVTGSVTEDDILRSIEFMNEKWESNRDMLAIIPIMNPESLMDIKLVPPPSTSFEFLSEPEEEPMPSEAWIKKQLKYEKNPMRIKQLNIMLNKKRKENKYGKGK